ncbi:MAG: hypothetical protein VB042_08555 [Victivallaceae bacterium]|nr:hypothetical protein [Victivallaceae bacterium]
MRPMMVLLQRGKMGAVCGMKQLVVVLAKKASSSVVDNFNYKFFKPHLYFFVLETIIYCLEGMTHSLRRSMPINSKI